LLQWFVRFHFSLSARQASPPNASSPKPLTWVSCLGSNWLPKTGLHLWIPSCTGLNESNLHPYLFQIAFFHTHLSRLQALGDSYLSFQPDLLIHYLSKQERVQAIQFQMNPI
jgi:hypothetical protein